MTSATLSPDLVTQVTAWRHQLHQIPETAFTERLTSEFVAGVLRDLGYDVATGIGGTGVVGSLTRGEPGRSVGLRSELDALPITEDSGVEYASRHRGAMHACGHDGHMAMLLGAAAVLAERGDFTGTVRAIFQPAEEPGRGAQAMVDDGLFERFPIDAVYGIHNTPGLAPGRLHTRPGPVMASEDNFTITIAGHGGHASAPHFVTDPLLASAEVITALQQIVARNVDPLATAVVSCTNLTTDGARNAIPSNVTITGDTRSFDAEVQALLERRIREISHGIASAHSATAEVTYTHEFGPTINDPRCVQVAEQVATSLFGADVVDAHAAPIMASEDFGVLAAHVPGCLAFLGNGTESAAGGTPLHSHGYRFNDAVLATGVAYLAGIVRNVLSPSSSPVAGSSGGEGEPSSRRATRVCT